MSPDAPRIATPAVGIDADERRLGAIARTLEAIGAATRRHGVTTCLHPHVGTWVETEAETEWLVERLDPALVALGPDSGHLAWAGVDVVAFARRHAERIAAVHVKDVRLDVVHRTRATDASYRDVVREGVWAEPGLGDLDLVGFLAALGAGFEGWAVVEVDRPSMGSPEESIEACGRWVESVVAADPSSPRGT